MRLRESGNEVRESGNEDGEVWEGGGRRGGRREDIRDSRMQVLKAEISSFLLQK